MSDNQALLILLESVLGKGNKTSRGNYSFMCPFCSHHKPKLEINLITTQKKENFWHCWICNARGNTIRQLFKKIKVGPDKYEHLDLIVIPSKTEIKKHIDDLSLPKEFIPLSDDLSGYSKLAKIEARHALNYLLNERKLTPDDIVKYNIGFCFEGKYEKRVIIPSYDENGILNYFIARSYVDSGEAYKNPPTDAKSAIGLELYINWDAPIILIEGMFDAITIKRNVIPLFGKLIHEKLMKKLVKSSVKKIYIALDPDAIKKALNHAETLMSYGKEVYLVEIDGKDANKIGFEKFLETLEHTYPLTFQSLLEKKLQLL